MASLTLTVTDVFQRSGRVYVRWSDKVEQEFRSLEEARRFAQELTQDRTFLRRLAIARYLQVDPTGSDPSLIEGHSITVTNENNTMVTVS